MQHGSVQGRRPVADDGVREPVEASPERAAARVRLPVGKPVQLRADDHLHVGPRAGGEKRALEAALAPADHDHAARLVGAVVLEIGCESDLHPHLLRERGRRGGERHGADGEDHRRRVDLLSPDGRQSEPPVRALHPSDVRGVDVADESRTEPVRVAKELLERDRLLAGLFRLGRPPVERPGVSGRENDVSFQSERSRMSGGIRVRHVCIGRPKIRTFLGPRRWAATDSP